MTQKDWLKTLMPDIAKVCLLILAVIILHIIGIQFGFSFWFDSDCTGAVCPKGVVCSLSCLPTLRYISLLLLPPLYVLICLLLKKLRK